MSLDRSPTPDGFRQTESGLVIPDAVKDREVWTDEEIKLLARATKLVNARGWYLTFTCPHPRCRSQVVVQRVEVVGGFELECQHKIIRCVSLKGKPERRR